ncbi:STAS domain-containing protein [Hamadaea sp. NPDC051192]|uniref:STAS domain-containing protein n=1 Tax=Hamadaea sp. NPDC051192 TaxID=3154940 RepID=UPI00343CDB3E
MKQMSPLSINAHPPIDGCQVLAVAGEIDLATSQQLRSAIEKALNRARFDRLVIDLEHVSFLDSTGIHTLMTARDWAAGRGVTLKVSKAHDMVKTVLAMTGVMPELVGDR